MPNMRHQMRLHPEPFEMFTSGVKTVELRLNDEKRQQIRVGDEIEFAKRTDETEKMVVRVTGLVPAPTMEVLAAHIPLTALGCPAEMSTAECEKMMNRHYVDEEIAKYGWLAIGIERIA